MKRVPSWLWWFAGLAVVLGVVVGLYASGAVGAAIAVGGGVAMAGAFLGGLAVVKLLLSPGTAVTGVARALVDEALRMKVALVFIVLLLLFVPLLPFLMDAKELLKYRLQFFLTWSVTAISVLLSLMTVFLACMTVSNEIAERQVHLTLTKPVARWQYLLGKWLGIVLLNAVLVSVAGAGVYTFAKVLTGQRARNEVDRLAVNEQIMTARDARTPVPAGEAGLQPMFEQRFAELQAEFPDLYKDAPTPEQEKAIRQQVMLKWHTLPPLDVGVYKFEGLGAARAMGPTVQLRVKPKASPAPPGDQVTLVFRVNGRFWPGNEGTDVPPGYLTIANDTVYVLDVPATAVSEDGVLVVEIGNATPPSPPTPAEDGSVAEPRPPSVSFTPGEGLEVLFKVGSFEANLAKGMLMLWLRLGFLAMLGIVAGSLVSFPVACLLCMLVYFTSAGSGYLAESLSSYGGSVGKDATLADMLIWPFTETAKHLGEGKVWDAVKVWIKLVGSGFMLLVPSLGEYNPIENLTDGRVIPWDWIRRAAGNVGLLWTLAVGVVGWLLFRRRELARVTV